MYRKNVASQFFCFQGVAPDGTIATGVTFTVRRCIDGTFAAGGGTVTEDGSTGWYKFAMTQADTNGNNISFNFTGTGAVPQTINFVTTAADPTDTVRFGLTALPNAAAEAAGGLYTRGTGAGQINQPANGQIDVNVERWNATALAAEATAGIPDVNVKNIDNDAASASGTVTFPNATLASTTNISAGTITTATNVTTVNGLAAGVITAASIATGAIDADALATDAVTEIWAGSTAPSAATIADAVLDEDMTAHQTQGTLGQAIGDPAADTNTIYKAVVTDAAAATVGLDVVAVKAETASIQTDTNDLQTQIGTAGAGLTNINLPNQTMDIIGNITGNLSGSVGEIGPAGINAASFDISAITAAAVHADVSVEIATAMFTANTGESYASSVSGSVVKEIADNAGGGTPPTAAAIADAVWDEAIAGHLSAGSTGLALNSAGAAGDPWSTAVPGAYGAGTAGKILGDNLNATVSSRATQTSVDDLPTNAELATSQAAADDATLAAIAGLNDVSVSDIWNEALPGAYGIGSAGAIVGGGGGGGLDAAGVRAAIGMASANLDTQLGDLPTNAELATSQAAADDATLAQIALVKAVTDKLDTTLEDADIPNSRFTVEALENAPSGGGGAAAVWDYVIEGNTAQELLDRAGSKSGQ